MPKLVPRSCLVTASAKRSNGLSTISSLQVVITEGLRGWFGSSITA
jgi:hypothetical protein